MKTNVLCWNTSSLSSCHCPNPYWSSPGRSPPFKLPWKEKEMRRCSTSRFHFHFLKLYTTHHIVHLTGASHYERPVDPRIEADVFEGLSSMVGGLRQRRNFVTTVILVMLALRPKQVKYERSQELQGRHIQQVPPPTNIWRRHLLKYIFQPKKTADRPLDQSFNVRRNKWQICAAPL